MQDLIDTAEASRRLGIDRTTITRQVAAGKIEPAMRVPGYRGKFLFDPAAIDALLELRRAS